MRKLGVHPLDEVGADLVAQPARTRVDQDRHLPLAQPACSCRRFVVDAVNPLELEEVIAGAERPNLVNAPLLGPRRNRARNSTLQTATGLRQIQVFLATDAQIFEQRPRPQLEHPVQIRAPDSLSASLAAGAHRHLARELVHQRLAPIA